MQYRNGVSLYTRTVPVDARRHNAQMRCPCGVMVSDRPFCVECSPYVKQIGILGKKCKHCHRGEHINGECKRCIRLIDQNGRCTCGGPKYYGHRC